LPLLVSNRVIHEKGDESFRGIVSGLSLNKSVQITAIAEWIDFNVEEEFNINLWEGNGLDKQGAAGGIAQ